MKTEDNHPEYRAQYVQDTKSYFQGNHCIEGEDNINVVFYVVMLFEVKTCENMNRFEF